MLLDPAINLMFQRMCKEVDSFKEKLEQAQNDLAAWKFTSDRYWQWLSVDNLTWYSLILLKLFVCWDIEKMLLCDFFMIWWGLSSYTFQFLPVDSIIIMAEMIVILLGWLPQMRETLMVFNLMLCHLRLILYKFRNFYIRWRKPCQLPGWMKNYSYYSATARIQTSNIPYSKSMGKESHILIREATEAVNFDIRQCSK